MGNKKVDKWRALEHSIDVLARLPEFVVFLNFLRVDVCGDNVSTVRKDNQQTTDALGTFYNEGLRNAWLEVVPHLPKKLILDVLTENTHDPVRRD